MHHLTSTEPKSPIALMEKLPTSARWVRRALDEAVAWATSGGAGWCRGVAVNVILEDVGGRSASASPNHSDWES